MFKTTVQNVDSNLLLFQTNIQINILIHIYSIRIIHIYNCNCNPLLCLVPIDGQGCHKVVVMIR